MYSIWSIISKNKRTPISKGRTLTLTGVKPVAPKNLPKYTGKQSVTLLKKDFNTGVFWRSYLVFASVTLGQGRF